jgi:hypothetical protein
LFVVVLGIYVCVRSLQTRALVLQRTHTLRHNQMHKAHTNANTHVAHTDACIALCVRDVKYDELTSCAILLATSSPYFPPFLPVTVAKELYRLQTGYPYGDNKHRMLVATVGDTIAGMCTNERAEKSMCV